MATISYDFMMTVQVDLKYAILTLYRKKRLGALFIGKLVKISMVRVHK
ncbi:hypothetical protein BN871_DX_00150 [Paenibacillus sp. P22]|nr:hypothetical protein BN871_DX_00150 [Paenibacillus sp. P22]